MCKQKKVSNWVLINTLRPNHGFIYADLGPSEMKSVGRDPTWTIGEGAGTLTTAEVVQPITHYTHTSSTSCNRETIQSFEALLSLRRLRTRGLTNQNKKKKRRMRTNRSYRPRGSKPVGGNARRQQTCVFKGGPVTFRCIAHVKFALFRSFGVLNAVTRMRFSSVTDFRKHNRQIIYIIYLGTAFLMI